MPSKDKIKTDAEKSGENTRPFTIFYVNPDTPEEVHTGTIMAHDYVDASALAASRFVRSTILYVRGIGENGFSANNDEDADESIKHNASPFPCARFIKGKFHSTTFNDEVILESMSDQT